MPGKSQGPRSLLSYGPWGPKESETTEQLLFFSLTEAEDIKKRWQEYTEELYKKDLHDPDNDNGVITHLEPDILECEVVLKKHHHKQS